MKEFRLIGKDIEGSLSPIIHNYIFKINNISARYDIMNITNKKEISILYELQKNAYYRKNITIKKNTFIISW